MVDMQVSKKDTAPAKIEKEKELVTLVARVVELEIQVQNLEQLVAKAQEDKEQKKGELKAEIENKKREVKV